MATKYLITTSIFSLTLISVVQTAGAVTSGYPASAITASTFSWTGFYVGGQIGNFSSKTTASYLGDGSAGKESLVKKELLPKLSGFVGGLYAGSNIDIDSALIIGIDTDIIWSDKKDTKYVSSSKKKQSKAASKALEGTSLKLEPRDDAPATYTKAVCYTLKQKWAGATRVRVGFVVDRMMPYVAGGVAYTQLRSIVSKVDDVENRAIDFSNLSHDEKKVMVGYTFGGGIDFAVTNNIIMRAEYRYLDFGKKKFAHKKIEMGYKTNDFRVGVAYKF
ncbi:outer membrane protein [Bartonella sp. B12(2025)]